MFKTVSQYQCATKWWPEGFVKISKMATTDKSINNTVYYNGISKIKL